MCNSLLQDYMIFICINLLDKIAHYFVPKIICTQNKSVRSFRAHQYFLCLDQAEQEVSSEVAQPMAFGLADDLDNGTPTNSKLLQDFLYLHLLYVSVQLLL